MRNRQLKHRGFTLIELLGVISIIALLIAILLPSLARAKELANRAVCSANVRGIIQSMVVYAQTNGNVFPCVPGDATAGAYNVPTAFITTPSATAPTAGSLLSSTSPGYYMASSKAGGDPLACWWVLVLENQITPKSFICPSDPTATSPSQQYFPNSTNTPPSVFPDFNQGSGSGASESAGQGESYSIAFPWSDGGAYAGAAPWWNGNQGADVPLVSDMTPYSSVATGTAARITTTPLTNNTYGPYIFNSGNHGGDGQNVGFGDDHVAFETNPYVGQSQANIFTTYAIASGPGTQTALPAEGGAIYSSTNYSATAPYDICMVPVRDVAAGVWH